MADFLKQQVTSSTTGLTYIVFYKMESDSRGDVRVAVEQDRVETIFRSVRDTNNKVKPLAPARIADDPNAIVTGKQIGRAHV